MARPILALADYSEECLFEEIAHGIPLIMRNAEHLQESAERARLGEANRASKIMQGLAEEEAAKILVLLDVVRGPEDPLTKANTLKNFNSHLAKRIYALMSSYPNIQSFGEFSQFVALERRAHYLDGPNDVDWIFPNSIHTERERELYVDYVRDITQGTGDCFWTEPSTLDDSEILYDHTPEVLRLCRALCDIGVTSADALADISEEWKDFNPKHDTSRAEIHKKVGTMLSRLASRGHCRADEDAMSRVVRYWTFPLWTFSPIKLDDSVPIDNLRIERSSTIQWIHQTEEPRDPPPNISRKKVEGLHKLYIQWKWDIDEDYAREHPESAEMGGPPAFRSASDIEREFQLPSHKRLEKRFKCLTSSERCSLLALGWFTRDRVADWPRTFEYAQERFADLNDDYQIGLAGSWLAGFNRWERHPTKFRAGTDRR